jgi:hypothetical protein
MVDVKTIIPALVIPLLLIIATAVYMETTDTTSFVFEETVTNESTGVTGDKTAKTADSAYDCKDDSVTAVYNGSTLMTAATQYNVTYVPLGVCTVSFGGAGAANITAGAINMSYTAYKGDGYTAFEKVNTGSYNGFKLASLLPYIVIAMIILVVIVGSFTLF